MCICWLHAHNRHCVGRLAGSKSYKILLGSHHDLFSLASETAHAPSAYYAATLCCQQAKQRSMGPDSVLNNWRPPRIYYTYGLATTTFKWTYGRRGKKGAPAAEQRDCPARRLAIASPAFQTVTIAVVTGPARRRPA